MQGRKLDPRAQYSRHVSMRMEDESHVSWGRSHEGEGAGYVYMFILARLCTKDTLSGRVEGGAGSGPVLIW